MGTSIAAGAFMLSMRAFMFGGFEKLMGVIL
jgi:hypothetical protein